MKYLILLLLIVACTAPVNEINASVIFEIDGQLGKEFIVTDPINAFELMRQWFVLEYQEFEFGPMINCINGVCSQEDEYWSLFVNGVYAEKGINQYEITQDIKFSWKLEKIN